MRRAGWGVGLLALGALLPGCDDPKATPAAPVAPRSETTPASADPAWAAAEARLRADIRGSTPLEFRGVQAFAQASPRSTAVCGQLNARGATQAFIPFVSVVTWPETPGGPPRIDQMVALTSTDATRVYVETLSRCLAGGGPAPSQRRAAPPPLPQIPSDLPNAGTSPLAAEQQVVAPAPSFTPAAGDQAVVLRQPGNLRMQPAGGSEVLRVVPRGQTLRVFATAPGGWVQVGTTEAEGWLHSSLVSGP